MQRIRGLWCWFWVLDCGVKVTGPLAMHKEPEGCEEPGNCKKLDERVMYLKFSDYEVFLALVTNRQT
jgi:hypothetical protein